MKKTQNVLVWVSKNAMRPCKLKSDEEMLKHASLAQQNCNCTQNLITVW
jgi:hypothetical protein